MHSRIQDMAGRRFAQLVAIRVAGKASSGDLKWEFRCDCGMVFVANGYYARCGKIINCPECAKARSRSASVTHGLTETPEYRLWTDIQSRCHNPRSTAYANYGGRGIVVCDRWRQSFEAFFADMGKRPPGLTIERENTNGNYEPGNCRWATPLEQANNKRNNIRICLDGVTKTLMQWSREFGVSSHAVRFRLRAGVTGLDLFKPSRRS